MPPETWTSAEANAAIAARLLARARYPDPAYAAERFVALPGVGPSLPLALLPRVAGFDLADVDEALDETRTLARLACLRGNVRTVSSADFAMLAAALKEVVLRPLRVALRERGIPPEELEPWARIVLGLTSGNPLTAEEIHKALGRDAPAREELPLILACLTASGALVRARPKNPGRGSVLTFAPREAWLPGVDPRAWAPAEARAELARRYFAAYGPATVADFAFWTGFLPEEADAAVAAAGSALDEGRAEWTTAPVYATGRPSRSSAPEETLLLPPNDPYVIAYADRARFVPPEREAWVYDPAGNTAPVVVVGGRVVGLWSHEAGRRRLSVRIAPFENAPDDLPRRVEGAVDSLLAFLDVPDVHFEVVLPPELPLSALPPGTHEHPLPRPGP